MGHSTRDRREGVEGCGRKDVPRRCLSKIRASVSRAISLQVVMERDQIVFRYGNGSFFR